MTVVTLTDLVRRPEDIGVIRTFTDDRLVRLRELFAAAGLVLIPAEAVEVAALGVEHPIDMSRWQRLGRALGWAWYWRPAALAFHRDAFALAMGGLGADGFADIWPPAWVVEAWGPSCLLRDPKGPMPRSTWEGEDVP